MTIRLDRRVLIAVAALLVVALVLGLGVFIGSGAGQPAASVAPAPDAANPGAGVVSQPVAPVNPSDPSGGAGVPIVRPEEAKQGVGKPTILFVDLRPADQYKQGHIPGALSLPYDEAAQRVSELPRDKSLVIYCDCRNDNDAAQLAYRLRPLGYADLWVLRTGWQGWKAAGGPVE